MYCWLMNCALQLRRREAWYSFFAYAVKQSRPRGAASRVARARVVARKRDARAEAKMEAISAAA